MQHVDIDGRRIEYRAILGDALAGAPLVFLHEGLGCAALWRDFPDKVASRLGRAALIYSRFGYGGSAPLPTPGIRTADFMHEEALVHLPRLLDRLAIHRPLLIGHSDGASIALIHAAAAGRDVAGLVLMAPHVVVEAVSIASIARIRQTYLGGNGTGGASPLRTRLARYHAHIDDAFLGWADTWLSPGFQQWSLVDLVGRVDVPVLLIQGAGDEYGTLAQIDAIAGAVRGPVRRLVLENCGHAPQRDREADVLDAIAAFARS